MAEERTSFFTEITASFSLFASLGTLVCCAIPALLVALGLGAVVAGLVADFPGLIWLSRNKLYIFIVAAVLLVAAGLMRKSGRTKTCPADPVKARACGRFKKAGTWIYWISVVLYVISVFVAYIAPMLL